MTLKLNVCTWGWRFDVNPILRTQGLTAFYGDAQALFGIDFELFTGELVAIIGANGAG